MTDDDITHAAAEVTPRALEAMRLVYDTAALFIEEHGYSPTIRELRDRCDYRSNQSISLYLHLLRRMGHVVYVDGTPRTLRLLNRP